MLFKPSTSADTDKSKRKMPQQSPNGTNGNSSTGEKTKKTCPTARFTSKKRKRVTMCSEDQTLTQKISPQYAPKTPERNRRVPNPLGIRARRGAPALADDHRILVVNARKCQVEDASHLRGCGAAAAREQTLNAAGASSRLERCNACAILHARGMSLKLDGNDSSSLCDQSTPRPGACVA